MVRNCSELGENAQKIVKRLMANDTLVNLLYYTDKDPLSHPPLTKEQKQKEVFEKLIKIIPRIGPKETAQSVLSIRFERGRVSLDNSEFKEIRVVVESIVPLEQWIIKNETLRPFAILSEIEKSLKGKTINGLGKMEGGDFDLNFLTDEISDYQQNFYITAYD